MIEEKLGEDGKGKVMAKRDVLCCSLVIVEVY